MSLFRASFKARSFVANAKRYSTTPTPTPKKSSNLPLYLGGAGIVGLGAYLYIDSITKTVAPVIAPKKVQEKSPLDPGNFLDFTLKKVEHYNHNTSKYIFELPNNDASLLPIASCVVVKSSPSLPDCHQLLDPKTNKPIIRPYTPISPSDKEGELEFLIKRYEEGKMSTYISGLKVGEKLAIKGPIVKIPYKENEFERIGMIAGGSGITPMYQILSHALSSPSNTTKFTLIFANLSSSDILLKEEFDTLQQKYKETFKVVYTVDKPEKGWTGSVGYVNKELIEKHLGPSSLGDKVKVLICGPPGQVAAISGKKEGFKQGALGGVLKELGYDESQVPVLSLLSTSFALDT